MLNPFSSSQFQLHIRPFGIHGGEHGGGTVLIAMRFRSGGISANEKLGCFDCRRAVTPWEIESNEQIDRRRPKA